MTLTDEQRCWKEDLTASCLCRAGELDRTIVRGVIWQQGGPFPPHSSHQNGLDVDVRYVRSNGSEGPVDFDGSIASLYDNADTQTLIDKFCNTGAIAIFVDDRANIIGQCTVTAPGHSSHFHVRYPLPQ